MTNGGLKPGIRMTEAFDENYFEPYTMVTTRLIDTAASKARVRLAVIIAYVDGGRTMVLNEPRGYEAHCYNIDIDDYISGRVEIVRMVEEKTE